MTHEISARIREALDLFAQTPARLAGAAQGKTPGDLARRPAGDDWTAGEVFAHMRAVDDIFTPRIFMVLAREQPLLLDFDERRWAEVAGYRESDFHSSLALFTLRRHETVAMLRRLPLEAWQRMATHENAGPLSLLDLVQNIATHEAEHCGQFSALLTPD